MKPAVTSTTPPARRPPRKTAEAKPAPSSKEVSAKIAGSSSSKSKVKKTVAKRVGNYATKYNWEALRDAFVEGTKDSSSKEDEKKFLNLKELSEHFDVPYVQVRQKSAKERWPEQRVAYQTKTAIERQRRRANTLATQAVDFDEKSLGAAKMGTAIVTARLAEIAKAIPDQQKVMEEARELQAKGLPVEKWMFYSAVNYKEIGELSRALLSFQQVGQRALGTDVQKHQIDMDATVSGQVEHTMTVRDEMVRPDEERLAAILSAFEQSGLLPKDVTEQILEAEVVSESEEDDEGDEGSEYTEAEVLEIEA